MRQRYVYSQTVFDLDHAVTVYQKARQLTLSTDSLLPTRLYNLGNVLLSRYELTKDPNDAEQAEQCYRDACISGFDYSLEWVLGSAKAWGEWAERRQAWKEAKEAYSYGLRAMDQLYRTQLLSDNKAAWLKDARDISGNAAYVLVRLNELQDAVVTLERNRTRALSEALTYQDTSIKAASDMDQQALALATQSIHELESEARAIEKAGGRDLC